MYQGLEGETDWDQATEETEINFQSQTLVDVWW